MPQVLIVGYGKIGRIKAFIWQSLGLDVQVFDTDPSKERGINSDGFQVFRKGGKAFTGIIDISTPAGTHFRATEWCLQEPSIRPRLILVEKPLASSPEELLEFANLIQRQPELEKRLCVNESYYQSSALQYIQQDLQANEATILNISVELSKNRLSDHTAGRFFDKSLDAIGIEMPHMLAILDVLDINLADLHESTPTLYQGELRYENQAVVVYTKPRSPTISLYSYLGDFRKGIAAAQDERSIIRTLHIQTNQYKYVVDFDPAPNCPRYHSKIQIYKNDALVLEKVLADNHLREHMRLFLSDAYLTQQHFIGIQKAMSFANLLITLRDQCEVLQVCESTAGQSLRVKEETISGSRV